MSVESGLGPTENSRDEILDATYRVLCERGYADMSMRAIAAELDKSKSLIHYHFDTKEELLLAFLDRFLDRLDETVADLDGDTAHERLLAFVDRFVVDPDDDRRRAFWLALLELRVRAARDDAYHDRLQRNSAAIREVLASIIEDGVDSGEFADVDADRVADTMYDLLSGARTRQATLREDEATLEARETVEEYVDSVLLAE